MIAVNPGQIELDDPIAIDPRPCELCGLTIDRHERVDDGDGPIFYCPDLSPDEMDQDQLDRRAELRRQEEVAAILARWDAMDAMDPPGAMVVVTGVISRHWKQTIIPPRSRPCRPAQSTIDAFFYVAALNDPDRLKAWLANHPKDAPHLHKLWKAKRC
jgi:hypothetical protein